MLQSGELCPESEGQSEKTAAVTVVEEKKQKT